MEPVLGAQLESQTWLLKGASFRGSGQNWSFAAPLDRARTADLKEGIVAAVRSAKAETADESCVE